jgi:hypothetical protein
VPDESAVKVGIESVVWYHPEAEQKIKSDEISVDDGAAGIQSVIEAAAVVVFLSGATTTKTALVVGPKKPKAKKPSPSKRKTPASKARKPGPPSDDLVFWLRFSKLCRYNADHCTTSVPRTKDGTNNALTNWIHYIRKRYKKNVLPATHKNILNGINFEWTAGQITKKGFEGWFAELVEYHKQHGTVKVLGENKKRNLQLANRGNYSKRRVIAVLTNKEKNQSLLFNNARCLLTLGWFLSNFICMDQRTVIKWVNIKIAI